MPARVFPTHWVLPAHERCGRLDRVGHVSCAGRALACAESGRSSIIEGVRDHGAAACTVPNADQEGDDVRQDALSESSTRPKGGHEAQRVRYPVSIAAVLLAVQGATGARASIRTFSHSSLSDASLLGATAIAALVLAVLLIRYQVRVRKAVFLFEALVLLVGVLNFSAAHLDRFFVGPVLAVTVAALLVLVRARKEVEREGSSGASW